MTAVGQPRQLGPDDLVLNHFSLAREHPLDDRLAAASAAGFAGIGLFVGEYLRLCGEGLDIEQLADLLDEHELVLADIEVVRVWNEPGPATETRERFEAAAWELADRFGCRYLQAIGPTLGGSLLEVAAPFAALCDRAADHGLLVGLEFLPFTDLVTPADVLAVVEAADRPNGGVCVDIWHHARGADDLDMIRAIPVDRVMAVQMSDGPRVPEIDDYLLDCLRSRVPPGRGEMDAAGFVALLLDAGYGGPFSLEVCSETGWAAARQHVQSCGDGMRAVLARARASLAGGGAAARIDRGVSS